MGTVIEEVSIIVGDYKHVIQKIEGEFWGGDKYAYRTGYWTFAAGRDNIAWCPTQLLTQKEYRDFLSQAQARGWDNCATQFLTQKEYQDLLSQAKAKGWDIFGGSNIAVAETVTIEGVAET